MKDIASFFKTYNKASFLEAEPLLFHRSVRHLQRYWQMNDLAQNLRFKFGNSSWKRNHKSASSSLIIQYICTGATGTEIYNTLGLLGQKYTILGIGSLFSRTFQEENMMFL